LKRVLDAPSKAKASAPPLLDISDLRFAAQTITHLSPNLNVEFLGAQLALSRTQIFRRVKAITGKGPLDYIRERRLIRADELLRTTDMTIQQVALQLCFSSPGYFTKCYKEQFGHLPSER
jgi:AraC-like DNA-binding protein